MADGGVCNNCGVKGSSKQSSIAEWEELVTEIAKVTKSIFCERRKMEGGWVSLFLKPVLILGLK